MNSRGTYNHPYAVANSHLLRTKSPSSFCVLQKGCLLAVGTRSLGQNASKIHIVNVEDNFSRLGEIVFGVKDKEVVNKYSSSSSPSESKKKKILKTRRSVFKRIFSIEEYVPNMLVALHHRVWLDASAEVEFQICDFQTHKIMHRIPLRLEEERMVHMDQVLIMNEKCAVFAYRIFPRLYFQSLVHSEKSPEIVSLKATPGFYPSCLVKISRCEFAMIGQYIKDGPSKPKEGFDAGSGSVQIWNSQKKICKKVIHIKPAVQPSMSMSSTSFDNLPQEEEFPQVLSENAAQELMKVESGYIPKQAKYYETDSRIVCLCDNMDFTQGKQSLVVFLDVNSGEIAVRMLEKRFNSFCFHLEFFFLAGNAIELLKDEGEFDTFCQWENLEYNEVSKTENPVEEHARKLHGIVKVDVLKSGYFEDMVICLEQGKGLVLYSLESIMRFVSFLDLRNIRDAERKLKKRDSKEMSSSLFSDSSDKDLVIQLNNKKLHCYKSLVFGQSDLKCTSKLDFDEDLFIDNEVFLNILFGKPFSIEEEIEILDYFCLFYHLEMPKQCCLITKEIRNVYGLGHVLDLLEASLVYFENFIPEEVSSEEEELSDDEDFIEKMRQFDEIGINDGDLMKKLDAQLAESTSSESKKVQNPKPVIPLKSMFTAFLLQQIQEEYAFELKYSPSKIAKLKRLGFELHEIENSSFELEEEHEEWEQMMEYTQGKVFKSALKRLYARRNDNLRNLTLVSPTGEKILVEKEIVRAFSAFFYRMLEFQGMETASVEKDGTLPIATLTHTQLKSFIEFIYTGKIQSNDISVLLCLLDFSEAFFEYKLKYYLIRKMRKIPMLDLRHLKFVFGRKRVLEIVIRNVKIIEYFVEYWIVSLKITKTQFFEIVQEQIKIVCSPPEKDSDDDEEEKEKEGEGEEGK